MRGWLILVLVAVAMAGCTEDDDAASEATLAYDSDGQVRDGRHSEAAFCSDGASLAGAGSVDSGDATLRVTDGDGQNVFTHTFNDGVELEGELMQGAAGDWMVEVERQGGFEGDYSFVLACT